LTAENEQLKHSARSLQDEFQRLSDIYKQEIVQSIEEKHKHEVHIPSALHAARCFTWHDAMQLHEAVGARELQLRLDMSAAEVSSLHECNLALKVELDRLRLQSRR
jgi:hypothetical protein